MDFSSFDDDLFADIKSGETSSTADYAPKVESPCWFIDCSTSSHSSSSACNGGDVSNIIDDDNYLENLRMRAAYFYWRRDYTSSVEAYEHLFSNLPSPGGAFKLETMESYARALIACGGDERIEEAERIATEFYNRAANYDQQLQGLNLLSDLYWRRGDFKRCAVASCCLASQMTGGGNADVWHRIGHCFRRWNDETQGCCVANQRKEPLIDERRLLSVLEEEKKEAMLPQLLYQKCLLRAYSLFATTWSTSVGEGKIRNEQMRIRIRDDLSSAFGSELHNILLIQRSPVDANNTTKPAENGDNDDQENDCSCNDQRTIEKRDFDKMLDVDLVTAFKRFLTQWIR